MRSANFIAQLRCVYVSQQENQRTYFQLVNNMKRIPKQLTI